MCFITLSQSKCHIQLTSICFSVTERLKCVQILNPVYMPDNSSRVVKSPVCIGICFCTL